MTTQAVECLKHKSQWSQTQGCEPAIPPVSGDGRHHWYKNLGNAGITC